MREPATSGFTAWFAGGNATLKATQAGVAFYHARLVTMPGG